jgi:hypothetical protein
VNPPARGVAERAADQNSDQWVIADLPRNGSGRTMPRIEKLFVTYAPPRATAAKKAAGLAARSEPFSR